MRVVFYSGTTFNHPTVLGSMWIEGEELKYEPLGEPFLMEVVEARQSTGLRAADRTTLYTPADGDKFLQRLAEVYYGMYVWTSIEGNEVAST